MRAPSCLSLRSLLALVSVFLSLPMLALAVMLGAQQVWAERRRIEAEAIRDARDLLRLTDQRILRKATQFRRLARDLDPALLESMVEEVALDDAIAKAQALMAGNVRGRVVVRIA